uniref:Death domain-containing protein n=1 Tax=Biomphalaria glabrata TaxID=6526 RepID=A0A2C9K8Y4_BIOGL
MSATNIARREQDETDGNAGFLRAARDGNLDEVLDYLKGSTDINTSNPNGLNALHLASKEGHINIVTELLSRGANVEAATKKGNTALHIASLAGHEEIVRKLVENGAQVNLQAQAGFTPLYMASQEGHADVVKFLLSVGANQGLSTEDGFTPLAVALQQGHDKVVSVLLEHDAKGKVRLPALHIAAKKDDVKSAALLLQNEQNSVELQTKGGLVNDTTKSGFTPLHIAAHYGNINVANLLIQRNADVNFRAKNNITPLHVASRWGKLNMVNLLLDNNATIDEKTRDGLTPLHCASRSGHESVVDTLLEKGAPHSAKTKNGLTPLHMAAQGDHEDCARLLLYHKASLNEVTVDYLTPLHVAAHCGNVKTAKLLLDRKCEPNARALNGFTPLHIACKKNRIKVVELLLKYGASIESKTESGLTPLHVASFMGHMNIVIYLIQHNANPNTATVRGETSLHLAARANQSDIIRILLRNSATVDARAREQQTPLHIAARLGNVDNVLLLLQHGASVDATTKDKYTPLHIAAKEGHEEVAQVLLEHEAQHDITTKKGFTPLHIAAKYGNIKVARLLLQKEANPDISGKNGLTPLHVATHYNHANVAQLLLENKANPHATAKNGYTPLHIAAKKNQMDIATMLLEYGAKPDAESKNGFTPLHLAAQEGHTDIVSLLLEKQANVNATATNGLTPMHLAAQEDRVQVAEILIKHGSATDTSTKAGYTPLHTACHFGQVNMVRFLLDHEASVNATTKVGYTPLHQAAQQGHVQVVNTLLKNQASPNAVTNNGQTPLAIAQRLGYISVVEILKPVTEVQGITPSTEDKYKVVSPETMQETFISDSEDEGGSSFVGSFRSLQYGSLTISTFGDDFMPQSPIFGKPLSEQHVYLPYYEGQKIHNREDSISLERGGSASPLDTSFDKDYMDAQITSQSFSAMHTAAPPITGRLPVTGEVNRFSSYSGSSFSTSFDPDNVLVDRSPVYAGKLKWKSFLISFMVDARGGAMRGCRHPGVRVIIPPRKCCMPTRITCRLVKKEKLTKPPPMLEGEGLAARVLEMGPAGTKFLGPILLEVPHFASLRGKEREVVILRSDNGETWYEHPTQATEDAVAEALGSSAEELDSEEDLSTKRIKRILTTDLPMYFALVSRVTRVKQESTVIGTEGGVLSSNVVPQVQAVFPEGTLRRPIPVGLQAQPIAPELVAKLLGNRVAVSPIVTIEPRRRQFHKPITLTIPVPKAAQKGMINQYGGERPTLRLLFSLAGNSSHGRADPNPAVWEDVTDSKPMTLVDDCVSFTTKVSARFWLIDCQNVAEAAQMASILYQEAVTVPYMAKFVVFAKRDSPEEGKLRIFCMTDDKDDKTLEKQEKFYEVARSRDIEVLEGRPQFVEMAGNLIPVTKSGDQLHVNFRAFRENRLPCTVKIRDQDQEPSARVAFMKEPKVARGEAPQTPICNLNIRLPDMVLSDSGELDPDKSAEIRKRHEFLRGQGFVIQDTVNRAEMKLSDIADTVQGDWVMLAQQLHISISDINHFKNDYKTVGDQALAMLHFWLQKNGDKATGNELENALRRINRDDVVRKCMYNIERVEDEAEVEVARAIIEQTGLDSKDSLKRGMSLDVQYDEQDMIKNLDEIKVRLD